MGQVGIEPTTGAQYPAQVSDELRELLSGRGVKDTDPNQADEDAQQ